jgi:hypothetical protein
LGSSFVCLRASGREGGVGCYTDLTDDTRAAVVDEAVENAGEGGAVARNFP